VNTKQIAKQRLDTLRRSRHNIVVIHYANEGFDDTIKGFSSRVAAVAIKRLESGQVQTFAVHREAEIAKIARGDVEANYQLLERRMLDNLFDFFKENDDAVWIHWNMRDSNFGFEALYHRYKVLQGNPSLLRPDRLFDLSDLLQDLHGRDYVPHQRMPKIFEMNGLIKKDLLSGKDEAEAFRKGELNRVFMSTLAKVDGLSTILELELDGKLKTKKHPIAEKIDEAHDSSIFRIAELILALLGLIQLPFTLISFLS
jgi:hypothetical protein